MGCIYSIKNELNDKVYIGLTIHFENRKNNHLSKLRRIINHNHWSTKNKIKEDIISEVEELCL